jgi:hypothetical protein
VVQRREREERARSPEPVAKKVVSQVVKAREERVSRARKGLKVHHCDLCPKVWLSLLSFSCSQLFGG